MSVGAMRHRLTFQQEVRTADGGGGASITWSDVATVWGEVKPLSGGEALRAQQLENPITHRIKVRYRADLTTAMRVSWRSRLFNVRSIRNPDERLRFLEIDAQENVGL